MRAFMPAAEALEFQVEQQWDGVEVRAYPPQVVAEALVQGAADRASGQAFPLLSGYLLGKNKGEHQLPMTAPVTQQVQPNPIADGHTVQFLLPRGTTLANAPEPLDERVRLRELPARRLAAIRYSGFWSEDNDSDHLLSLQLGLHAAGQDWTGEPVYARYNPAFTPWFLRRNEIWLALP